MIGKYFVAPQPHCDILFIPHDSGNIHQMLHLAHLVFKFRFDPFPGNVLFCFNIFCISQPFVITSMDPNGFLELQTWFVSIVSFRDFLICFVGTILLMFLYKNLN